MKIEAHTEAMEDQLVGMVANRVWQELGAKMRERVEHMVDAEIESKLDELARDLIEPKVREAMEDGWQKTNFIGEPKGERITVKERLSQFFSDKIERGGIGNGRAPRVQIIAEEIISQALRKELRQELEDARKAFRKQVDDVLAGKLTEALRGAVGLR